MTTPISGWLLSSGAAIDNLGVSVSLVKVRDLVRQYLLTTRKPEQVNILSQLTSQEGATSEYIAKIIAHMKPPIETAVVGLPGADVGNPAAVLGLPGEEGAKPKAEKPADVKPDNPKPADAKPNAKPAADDGQCVHK